jgi:hypothetical protein
LKQRQTLDAEWAAFDGDSVQKYHRGD